MGTAVPPPRFPDRIVQCFMSPPTQYRLRGRLFLQVKRPNQQYHSSEGSLVFPVCVTRELRSITFMGKLLKLVPPDVDFKAISFLW